MVDFIRTHRPAGRCCPPAPHSAAGVLTPTILEPPVIRLLTLALALLALATPTARADFLIGSHDTNSILRYDQTTGAYLGEFVPSGSGGLLSPHGFAFGPDGNLYVAHHVNRTNTTGRLSRYDGQTGAFLGVVIPAGGGLVFGDDLLFGPNGTLYVADYWTSRIQRYDPLTGASLGAISGGGLSGPAGLALGSDGNLYAANQDTGTVVRFNATTGAALGTFVTAGSGGLGTMFDITFGPDGNL